MSRCQKNAGFPSCVVNCHFEVAPFLILQTFFGLICCNFTHFDVFFLGWFFTSPRLLGTRAALRTLVGMIRQSPMGYSETSPGLDLFTH